MEENGAGYLGYSLVYRMCQDGIDHIEEMPCETKVEAQSNSQQFILDKQIELNSLYKHPYNIRATLFYEGKVVQRFRGMNLLQNHTLVGSNTNTSRGVQQA